MSAAFTGSTFCLEGCIGLAMGYDYEMGMRLSEKRREERRARGRDKNKTMYERHIVMSMT